MQDKPGKILLRNGWLSLVFQMRPTPALEVRFDASGIGDAVIVNYNAGKLLADCVSSVFAAEAAQAIVVDNASNDDSIDYLKRFDAH
jgi:bifunctional ADP-heptose synthase (sugar kinase/adenylyltransferase)